MINEKFPQFIDRILSHEGGYSNDHGDPGNWTGGNVGVGQLKGTKFGIAANTYPTLDIRNLTRDQAIAIYKRDFWYAARCDQLPPMVAFQLLDGAVNSGIHRATVWLQQAVGATPDGKLGPKTLGAIQATDPNDIGFLFIANRLDFMNDLKTWERFGRGWAQRIVENLRWAAKDN